MPPTRITLASQREGRPQFVDVEMTGEDLKSALSGGGPLVRLPTGDDEFVYVNPAHVVMALESSDDEGPYAEVFG